MLPLSGEAQLPVCPVGGEQLPVCSLSGGGGTVTCVPPVWEVRLLSQACILGRDAYGVVRKEGTPAQLAVLAKSTLGTSGVTDAIIILPSHPLCVF